MEFPELSNRLRALMVGRGMSGLMLAAATDIPAATINRYLNGNRVPKIDNLITLADFFGVSVDYLIGRQENFSDQFTEDVRDMVNRYTRASAKDRAAVDLILSDYDPA